MAINPILNIESSADLQVYEFESQGRATLKKRISFSMVNKREQIYNLALCTVLDNGSLDCESETRNGDMNSVLETTAHIAILYLTSFPDRKIFLTGSDDKRSRKYQMGINSYLTELQKNFLIEGIIITQGKIVEREIFKPGKNYQAFLFCQLKN